jgi:prolyl oligopeptidase
VIPEGRDAIDLGGQSVTLVDHQLIVNTLHEAHSRVITYGLDGMPRREISLPGPGTAAGFDGHPHARETFYSFTDLITPPTVYRYDLESGASSVVHAPQVAFDPTSFEERQLFYPGKDGTRIPMSLAYRKGLKLQGDSPLLLYGYGGFGLSTLPVFDPAHIAWMEMGGVFAIANIRGGTTPRYSGSRFTAAPTAGSSSARVSRNGRTCSGRRSPRWACWDMLRFNRFGQGAGWEGDYGSPDDPREFQALYAYSPVQNVHRGTHYPATLVITGDHDTRVMPMHSFKFAAALQTAQAGPAPVLLAVDPSSGHGGGETVTQAIAQRADIYAFLAENLDLRAH